MRMLERHLTEVLRHFSCIFWPSPYMNILSVFKFCVIGGIFLIWFADSVLFTMMIKTEFEKPVDTHQDLLDREMSMGILWKIYLYLQWLALFTIYFLYQYKNSEYYIRFGFLRICRCKNWSHTSKLDPRHQRYRVDPIMGPSAHCRVPLRKPTSE